VTTTRGVVILWEREEVTEVDVWEMVRVGGGGVVTGVIGEGILSVG
jgi:hypothetical protein